MLKRQINAYHHAACYEFLSVFPSLKVDTAAIDPTTAIGPNHSSRTLRNTATRNHTSNCGLETEGYSPTGILWKLAQTGVTRPFPVKVSDSRIELVQKNRKNLHTTVNWFNKKYTTAIDKRAYLSFSTDRASMHLIYRLRAAAILLQSLECPLATGIHMVTLFLNY